MSSIGPQIPAHLLSTATDNDAAESDEDDYTPALPPELAAARKAAGPSSEPTPGPSTRRSPSPPPPRRVVGPAFPTARPRHDIDFDSDSDSDADIGPQPLPADAKPTRREISGVEEFLEREARRRKNVEEAKQPKKLVREEWMLVPPKAGDLLGCALFSLFIYCWPGLSFVNAPLMRCSARSDEIEAAAVWPWYGTCEGLGHVALDRDTR